MTYGCALRWFKPSFAPADSKMGDWLTSQCQPIGLGECVLLLNVRCNLSILPNTFFGVGDSRERRWDSAVTRAILWYDVPSPTLLTGICWDHVSCPHRRDNPVYRTHTRMKPIFNMETSIEQKDNKSDNKQQSGKRVKRKLNSPHWPESGYAQTCQQITVNESSQGDEVKFRQQRAQNEGY